MDRATFDGIRDLVYRRAGISLQPGKEALVEARVGKRLRALGMKDQRDYLDYVLQDASGNEVVQLLDVISTNVTRFFREADHFDLLEEELADWLAAGRRRIRVWSAASSSGEEPYTIAITCQEVLKRLKPGPVDLKILATDISTRVLATARQGVYGAQKVNDVPAALRDAYFTPVDRGKGAPRVVTDELKRMVAFRRLNLSDPPFPMQGPFDAVFCRNVMIYFDQAVRGRLVREIERLLRPGGLLLIGHSENLLGVGPGTLETVRPSVYRKCETAP